MTRKDYELLAAALTMAAPSSDAGPDAHEEWAECCHQIGEALKSDNPNFNRIVFYKACATRKPMSSIRVSAHY